MESIFSNINAGFHNAACSCLRASMPVVISLLTILTTATARAEGPVVSIWGDNMEIAKQVARVVYFAENEHNWPVTYQSFLAHSNLRRISDHADFGRVSR